MVCRRVGTDLVRSDPLQRPVSESGQSTDLHAVLEIYHSLCEIERIKSAKRVSRGVVLVWREDTRQLRGREHFRVRIFVAS